MIKGSIAAPSTLVRTVLPAVLLQLATLVPMSDLTWETTVKHESVCLYHFADIWIIEQRSPPMGSFNILYIKIQMEFNVDNLLSPEQFT